ncbi:Uncharacterized protein APZ42_031807 [Daphnia magna]|uniref:Uncharacterized protein n=1 Tax=Daphnia magna TaxID=35525 RepID=A0A164MIT8_9CRUS|nr:Uncharacterized protein APZ42_031807 [Daphnia magna]
MNIESRSRKTPEEFDFSNVFSRCSTKNDKQNTTTETQREGLRLGRRTSAFSDALGSLACFMFQVFLYVCILFCFCLRV